MPSSVRLESPLQSLEWVEPTPTPSTCALCQRAFHFLRHRHICRMCHGSVCKQCLSKKPPHSVKLSGRFAKCCHECAHRRSAPSMPAYDAPSPLHATERQRLAMLHTALDVMSLRPEAFQQGLDALCHFAADAFQSPIVAVTFMEANVHVFQAAVGVRSLPCLPRADALCDVAITSKHLNVYVDLAAAPSKYTTNSFILAHGVQFYAGAPILVNDAAIGTVCLMGLSPRRLWTDMETDLLLLLARLVAAELLNVPSVGRLPRRNCATPREMMLLRGSETENNTAHARTLSQARTSAMLSPRPHSFSSASSLMLDPRDWVPNHARSGCRVCRRKFSFPFRRKHHCRMCGEVVCNGCSRLRPFVLPLQSHSVQIRVCSECHVSRPPDVPTFSPNIRLLHASPTADDYLVFARDDALLSMCPKQRASTMYHNSLEVEKLARAFAELVYAPTAYLTPASDAMGMWMTLPTPEARRTIQHLLSDLLFLEH